MIERKDRIRVHIAGQEFSVVGGSFQDMLAAVKQINGRRFLSGLKVWQLPGTLEEIKHQLDLSGYQLEGGHTAEPPRPSAGTDLGADRIRVVVEGRQLAVVGGSFQDMLATVKNLPGRRFESESKTWQIPGELALIKGIIQSAGFELAGSENISPGDIPPMEQPDFLVADQMLEPPPFEEPDFFGNEDSLAPPDWWDDPLSPPPVDTENYFDEAAPFDFEPDTGQEQSIEPKPVTIGKSDRIRIRLGQRSLVVTGGSFQEMLTVIKGIPGRRFNTQEKTWDFPDEVGLETVQRAIKTAGFEIRVTQE